MENEFMKQQNTLDLSEEVVKTSLQETEHEYEKSLRPESFSDFIGQSQVIEHLDIMIKSAKIRSAHLEHVLFSGPPGLGKTSLAMLVAHAMGTKLHIISAPLLERKADLAAILSNLEAKDILFIDEIHRLNISIEELLYSAMEDFRLDIVVGQGVSARTVSIDLAPFTLVGATTRSGNLSHPLRDRFMGHFQFELYNQESLSKILAKNAKTIGINIPLELLNEVSKRSRGTPRIANRILKRIRDFNVVEGSDVVTMEHLQSAFDLLQIDEHGLNRQDRSIIKLMHDHYNGGPVGIDSIAASLGIDRNTLEEVHEPFLLTSNFIIRTSRGRVLTAKAYEKVLHQSFKGHDQ